MKNLWERVGAVGERGAMWIGVSFALLGLALIAGSFRDAASTADLRLEMQDLIAGGAGGLALIVLGSTVMLVTVVHRTATRYRPSPDGLADATAELEPVRTVVVSGGSFHVESCSLVSGAKRKARRSVEDALAAGLVPCGLCLRPLERT